MKKTAKTILRDFVICNNIFHSKKNGTRVLCFHDIQDGALFENRMKWLLSNFTVISLEAAIAGKKGVALTFDDGYLSWTEIVAPILLNLNLPATFFVNSNLLDLRGDGLRSYLLKNVRRSEGYLNALTTEGLKELGSYELFEIGGHTKDHIEISDKSDFAFLAEQVGEDKKTLEQIISASLKYFAYPFGQFSNAPSEAQEVVRKAGYENAFLIVPGYCNKEQPSFLLPRDSLELYQSEKLWMAWLSGSYDQLVKFKLKTYSLLGIKRR